MKQARYTSFLRPALAVSLLAGVAACASGPSPQPGMAAGTPLPELGQDGYANSFLGANYTLRPSDVIRVSVFREEGLSFDELPINAEGQISFPLIGSVAVAGQTPSQLEAAMEERLGATFLRDPDVTVNVVEYASHRVTVEGQVRTPGIYQFEPGTRLSGAIALAAGTERVADKGDIAVFRQTDQGVAVAKFDYNAVQAGTMLDPILMPGDRVVVGTSGLSQFWQDFLKSLPLFALFTRL